MFNFLKNLFKSDKPKSDNWFPDIDFLQDDLEFIKNTFKFTFITLENGDDNIYTNGFITGHFLYSYILRNNRYDLDGIYIVDEIYGGNRTHKTIGKWIQIVGGIQFSSTNHIVTEDAEYFDGPWNKIFKENIESLKKSIQNMKMEFIKKDCGISENNLEYFKNKFSGENV